MNMNASYPMRHRIVFLFLLAALVLLPSLATSLSAQARGAAAPPAKPAPRFPDGKPNLGITPEEKGLWLPQDRTNLGRRSTLTLAENIPFQPWAKQLYEERQVKELEPHTRCHPSGVAREFQTPYGVDFVHMPDIQRMYIFDVGGPHTFRTIYMDAKTHPAKIQPTEYGHAIGHWEGDTLVVDTVGFSEDFWVDRTGLPHTEKLHTIERFTRTDFNTIKYEVTIEDPNVYTKPWGGGFNLRWSSGIELFEYVCQDNNKAPLLMAPNGDGVSGLFISPIVP